jgi:hypothetical protein
MNRIDIILSRFPQFYQSEDSKNVLYSFIEAFAQQLNEAEEDLLRVMNAHWVQTADNELPKNPMQQRKGDLDKIFALYLEKLGGTALIKQLTRTSQADDDLYRQRIVSLINVLKSGAVTKQGIQNIIAANIGIADDMPYAQEAKERIRIVEFLMDSVEAQNQLRPNEQKISLFEAFTIKNEGSAMTIPVFRLKFNTVTSNTGRIVTPPLINVKIRNVNQPSKVIECVGEVQADDILFFLSEGAFLNGHKCLTNGKIGLPISDPVGKRTDNQVNLPIGDSTFQIEANWRTPIGRFDSDVRFDNAVFADSETFTNEVNWEIPADNHPIARFDDNIPIHNSVFTNRETFATLEISYPKRTYAAFRAVVPWSIAGFSSTIEVTRNTLDKLKIFNVPEAILADFKTLIRTYETLESFYDAFNKVESLPKETQDRRYLSELLLREADLKDKYAHFHVNPRDQLAAIVERVKAAGVYSEVAFEKRFGEHQQLEDRLKIIITHKESQEMAETNFRVTVQFVEKLESNDALKFTAGLTETLELEDSLKVAAVLAETFELKDTFKVAAGLVETLELKDTLTIAGSGEKRFDEQQFLEDRLNITQTTTQRESQEMEDKRFRIANSGQLVEKLELEDTLKLSGVFDFTSFDSLNGFA